MAYKKGPHGTIRKYSKTDGKYVKESFEEILVRVFGAKKKKHSSKERELARRQLVRDKAEASLDPCLFDVYYYIEKAKPGCTQLINAKVNYKKPVHHRKLILLQKNCLLK